MDAIILAGGRSSRMGGEDKAVIQLGDKQIIQHVAEQIGSQFDRLIIVSNTGAEYDIENAVYTKDEIPYLGPLGGILAGLKASDSYMSFVTACDMPFVDRSFMMKMFESVKNTAAYDVIVPAHEGKVEPLFGFYAKSCMPHIEQMLGDGKRKVVSFYPFVKTLIIKASTSDYFFNVNDLNELNRAKLWLSESVSND